MLHRIVRPTHAKKPFGDCLLDSPLKDGGVKLNPGAEGEPPDDGDLSYLGATSCCRGAACCFPLTFDGVIFPGSSKPNLIEPNPLCSVLKAGGDRGVGIGASNGVVPGRGTESKVMGPLLSAACVRSPLLEVSGSSLLTLAGPPVILPNLAFRAAWRSVFRSRASKVSIDGRSATRTARDLGVALDCGSLGCAEFSLTCIEEILLASSSMVAARSLIAASTFRTVLLSSLSGSALQIVRHRTHGESAGTYVVPLWLSI